MMKVSFAVMILALCLVSSIASAETLTLDKNICTYQPEINKDYCYAEYEVCDPLIDIGLIEMKYADMKEVTDLKLSDEDLKIELSGLDTELDFKSSKVGCYKIELKGWKSPLTDIDHVLCYDDACHIEYALWNGTYTYRVPLYGNISALSADTYLLVPIEIYLNSSYELFWCNFTVGNTNDTLGYVYFNDQTDYICVSDDETSAVTTVIDNGHSSNYGSLPAELTGFMTFNDSTEKNGLTVTEFNLDGDERVAGKVGQSYELTANSDYLDITSHPSYTDFTVCLWWQEDDVTSASKIFSKYNTYAWGGGIDLVFRCPDNPSGDCLWYAGDAGAPNYHSQTIQIGNYSNNVWSFDCLQGDSSNFIRFYHNSVLIADKTISSGFDSGTETFYIHQENGAQSGQVFYDNLMTFDKVLTADEIKLLYYSQEYMFPNGSVEENGTNATIPNATIPNATLPVEMYYCENDNYLHVIEKDLADNGSAVFNEYLIPCPHGCFDNVTQYGGACSPPPIYIVGSAFMFIMLFIIAIYSIPKLLKKKRGR